MSRRGDLGAPRRSIVLPARWAGTGQQLLCLVGLSHWSATMWCMSSDGMAKEPVSDECVELLSPGMTGRWRVLSRRSEHLWDLDEMTYARLRGGSSSPFAHDGVALPIRFVERWPQVGGTSFLYFDDPEDDLVEQWRISSTIRRIERADAPEQDAREER